MFTGKTAVCGDWHQAREYISELLVVLHKEGYKHILQVGDIGFMGDIKGYIEFLDTELLKYDMDIYFIDGNHEDFDWLLSRNFNSNGTKRVTDRITYLPRGFQTTVNGTHFTFVGGGVSVDKNLRTKGKDWWPEEILTDSELTFLKVTLAKTDILVMHDVPGDFPLNLSDKTAGYFKPELIEESNNYRTKLEGLRQALQPSVVVSGHYHFSQHGKVPLEGKDVNFHVLNMPDWYTIEGNHYMNLQQLIDEVSPTDG